MLKIKLDRLGKSTHTCLMNKEQTLPTVVRSSSTPYERLLTAVHNETRSVMFEVGMSYDDTLDLVLNGIKDNLTTFNNNINK